MLDKAETWLRRCACPVGNHAERCEIGLVLSNCDSFAETVETEFERIQNWYRTPRFAVDGRIKELVKNYRTLGRERAEADSTYR